ncbi:hypothetical protein HN51_051832 [Arachis hypogaea]|uniref:Uncharacterized protein n=1 Tax=Arachis hypogaea TaxID=3818 RepID=A0A445CDB4_ARAHY|nr:uncharacterized protein LOC107609477 isoform X1 [Arachis ipaensis]XP_025665643.1 uncharacterized protein LOC112764295 [Arachis hypogaea]QHN93041.1 uncharacterized protein DS421_17g589260 [Arachis hypogaea]RYR48929.1 hypothetical protein Ahy_A07g035044 isoform A [Arachis hypogaea]RYR48930.1 hypothetical protein Ahy_A07g035044 isoform B [Arachis hypogaea]
MRDSIKFESGDSHMLVKREDFYSEEQRRRAERRWKRRGLSLKYDPKPNCFVSATRISVKSCGDVAFSSDNDVHIVEDEVDEDYRIVLDGYLSEISNDISEIEDDEVDEDYRMLLDRCPQYYYDISNIGHDEVDEDFRLFLNTYSSDNYNADSDTVYISDNDHDLDNEDKMFVENLRNEGNSYISSISMHNQHIDISYGGKEGELEETGDALESQQVPESEKGPPSEITGSDVYRAPGNNCNSQLQFNDADEEYETLLPFCRNDDGLVRSNVKNNPLILNHAFDNANVQCDVKEQTVDKMECYRNLHSEGGPFDIRPSSDDSVVPKNNCNTGLDSHNVDEDYQIFLNINGMVDESLQSLVGSEAGRSSSIRNKSQVSDHPFGNPSVQFDVVEEHTVDPVESDQTERGQFIRMECSDDSIAPKNNCHAELQSDSFDEDYKAYLNSYSSYRGTDKGLMSPEVGGELNGRSSCVRNNSQVSGQGYHTPEGQCDVDKEQRGGQLESQQSLQTEGAPVDRSPHLDVSGVSMSNTESRVYCVDEDYQRYLNSYMADDEGLITVRVESDNKRKSSNVRHSSQASDQAFLTVDGNLMHMQHKSITKTCKADTSKSCSDSDVILLEPNQIGENSPFIFSRDFDSSYFENETNPRDSGKLSELKTRLLKDLNRPYNQEEHDKLLDLVHVRLHKERHAETRQGVVKSYRSHGVNKSYLELYPDLALAIKFKEPHKVLILLRGFSFWLQNLTHAGVTMRWIEESCLEILQRM